MQTFYRFTFLLRFITTIGLIIYVLILYLKFGGIRPDQIFFVLLMTILTYQRKKYIHLFLIDWLPAIVFLILYDMMRGIAPLLYEFVHVTEPYIWEKTLFGWFTGGEVPPLALQEWVRAHADSLAKRLLDSFFTVFYILHFVSPMILMWVLWKIKKDRRMFYRFVYSFTILNFMALTTFILYPSAPPWYYYEYGDLQPSLTHYGEAPGGLIAMDNILELQIFTTVWATFNANYFAAVPSLHGTWPLVIAIFTVIRFGRNYWPIFLYPLFTCIAGVYLNHHYIVDYIIGWIYWGIAYMFCERILMPKFFDRFLDYKLLKGPE
jgi:hypothetical protein